MVQVVAFAVLMSTGNYSILIASLFILGMMATIRCMTGTIYLYELMMKSSWASLYLFLCLLGEGVAGLLAAVYFTYISHDWNKLAFGILTSLVLGTIVSFLLPESPRYLIATGKIEQAQKAYEMIAKLNRANPGLVSLERIETLFK